MLWGQVLLIMVWEKKLKKIILLKGQIETLEFFSIELAKAFKKMGDSVFIFDINNGKGDISNLQIFLEKGNTVLITFNFFGIGGEKCFYDNNKCYWDDNNVECYNIIVDHPLYYHDYLKVIPKKYYHISIDRNHEKYVKRFFKNVECAGFIPLAGTSLCKDVEQSYEHKVNDVIFTGNYCDPQYYNVYIERCGKEYSDFYHGIIDDMLDNTSLTLEETIERHLIRENGAVSEEELMLSIKNMSFLDTYIRFFERQRVLESILKAGVKVTVFGANWELACFKGSDNLINKGRVDSYRCLKEQLNSKISVNVMPWFKDGAHDRIFNSMANKALSVTDSSIYLREEFKDHKSQALFYDLNDTTYLGDAIMELLNRPKELKERAIAGYYFAANYHLWYNRACDLDKIIEKSN